MTQVCESSSPGLDRPYSTALGNYVRSLSVGERIYWRDGLWSKEGPGVEFVKTVEGGIRPAPRRVKS